MSTPRSTNLVLNSFSFGASIEVRSADANLDVLGNHLPSVKTVVLTSRSFDSYDECISSCKRLMCDFLDKINVDDVYKIGSEVNPVFSNTPTLSKDWSIGEVARVWVYDKSMEKTGQIHAVGQARVFGSAVRSENTLN